jgi:hypothetical protein
MLLFGIRINKVSGFRMKKFLKNVSHASIWTNDEPEGWISGKWFIGYVQIVSGERKETRELWIISTKKFYDSNVREEEVTKNGRMDTITYWVREGVFWNLTYSSRQLSLPKNEIYVKQTLAIEQIMEVFDQKKYSVCLLHGIAGGGKSMTVQYLCAKLLKTKKCVHLSETLNLHEPGDNFDSFYNKIAPTQDSPLVIVFEEVDGIIEKIHSGKIEQKHYPIQIKNKTDWNSFLDKFDREIYPHVILVMTTNKRAEYFDDLDPSYMREGRVNLKIKY